MNDDLSPTDRGPIDPGPIDDDLVSAVLDGEATAAERAMVEGSADARHRLEELRGASAAVGEPVAPLAGSTVDDMVAAAIAGTGTAMVVEARPSPVTAHDEVGARRERRASRGAWRRAVGAVAAVAAIVVLVAGAAALVRAEGDRSSDSASSAASGDATSEKATDAGRGAAEAATPSSGLVPPDLGPLGDAQTVLDRYAVLVGADLSVTHQFDSGSSSTSAGAAADQGAPVPAPLGCPVPPIEAAPGERWSATADALLPDGPVLVMSNGLAPGVNRVLVVDATTCAVLAERTI